MFSARCHQRPPAALHGISQSIKNAKLQRVNWKPVQETQFGKGTCRFIEGQRGALVMPKWFFCMLMVVSAPLSVSNFPLSSAATILPSCLQRVIASLRNVCKLPLLLTVCVCVTTILWAERSTKETWPPFQSWEAPCAPKRVDNEHQPNELAKETGVPLDPPQERYLAVGPRGREAVRDLKVSILGGAWTRATTGWAFDVVRIVVAHAAADRWCWMCGLHLVPIWPGFIRAWDMQFVGPDLGS